jgi:pimeloyl-ACP methyl ester carboxylesterase
LTAEPAFPRRDFVALSGGGHLSVAMADGAGPAIVLLHGLTDCADSFRLIAPCLSGHRLIVPDLRGHGQSVRTGPLTIPAFAADLSEMLDALEIGAAVVVGHSMGAMVATELAAMRRDMVGRLVLLAGSLRPVGQQLDELRRTIAALPGRLAPDHPFFATWHHCVNRVPPTFLARLARNAATSPLSDWLTMIDMVAAHDGTAQARGLDLPVLAISGRQDPLFPPDHLSAIAAAFPVCTARLVDACGHNPHWEQPQSVARAILDFAGLAGAGLGAR